MKGKKTKLNTEQAPAIIEVKKLTKKFGNLLVLDGIDQTIRVGEKVVIVGPSGSGKSTFLRCLNCMEDPTSGQIFFDNVNLCDMKVDINLHRQKMGMVFQSFNLFNNLNVLENITLAPIMLHKKELKKARLNNAFLPLYNKYVEIFKDFHDKVQDKRKAKLEKKIEILKANLEPIEKQWEQTKQIVEKAGKNIVLYDENLTKIKFKKTSRIEKLEAALRHIFYLEKREAIALKYNNKKEIVADAKDKAYSLLKRIGLEEKAEVYPSTLSGGQKQRIAIIRALAMEPKVMLFDEPTSALDPEMVGEVLELIKQLADEGMTMIIVTHEIGFARVIGTRILFMDSGKIVEENQPEEFFQNPQNERLKEFLSKVISQ